MRKFYISAGANYAYYENFLDRLKKRLDLREVNSEEECDFVMAFVHVVSRIGTDIESALSRITTSQPVVLVVLHHTFDQCYIPPDSKRCVRDRSNIFAVDCLFYEDEGLLTCIFNDKSLKDVTDYLIEIGASPILLPPLESNCKPLKVWGLVCVGITTVAVVVVVVVLTQVIGKHN